MFTVTSYPVALVFCLITMLCWGSWANTQKLATQGWRFQLFYWDYALGVLLFSLLLAFTLGSSGGTGRGFLADLHQAEPKWLQSALLGGVLFNLSNILLVAAIDIAGMAVAFPVGVGLALVLGVISTYHAHPSGNVLLLTLGVGAVVVAIILDALAYRRLSSGRAVASGKGLTLAVVAGVLMGFFYSYVARTIDDVRAPVPGMLTPYTAIVFFSLGVFLSNFLWNTLIMLRPFSGEPVKLTDYFTKGTPRLHLVGLLGGAIWNLGMSFNILAGSAAGPSLSYGLGQGATMVGALWGVFVWKEFRNAPAGTNKLLAAMFVFYLIGLGVLIAART